MEQCPLSGNHERQEASLEAEIHGPQPLERCSSQAKVESGFMIQAAFGWPEVGPAPVVEGRGQEDGQAVVPTGRLAASSVLAPATNSDQWPPVAKHTAAKRSRSALALAAFGVL